MMKYVAFLRGINVGGRIVKMEDLRACFETLKLHDIKTILQTGNVLFDSPEKRTDVLTARIEAGLARQFNYPARVIVLPIDKLQAIIEAYPFESQEDSHSYVVFLAQDIGSDLLKGLSLDPKFERIALGDGVIYWQVKKGITLESDFGLLLGKTKYKADTTNRNLNTLQKILA